MTFKKRVSPLSKTPSIDAIRAYLTKKGWMCMYDWQGKIEYYEHDLHPGIEIKLTVDKNILKFDERLEKFLDDLAKTQGIKKETLLAYIGDCEEQNGGTVVPQSPPEVSVGIDPVKPRIHDENGKFLKGNRVAAIPGELHMASIKKHRHLIAARADELIQRAMDLALTKDLSKTNVNCLMDLLKLYLPSPKAVTFVEARIDVENLKTLMGLKEESAKMVKQIDEPNTSLESIAAALEIFQTHLKFIEAADIEPRMREIEYQMGKAKG